MILKPERLIYSVIEFIDNTWVETARTAYSWQAKDMAQAIFTMRKEMGEEVQIRAINRNFYTGNSETTGIGILADFDTIPY